MPRLPFVHTIRRLSRSGSDPDSNVNLGPKTSSKDRSIHTNGTAALPIIAATAAADDTNATMNQHSELDFLDSFDASSEAGPSVEADFRTAILNPDTAESGLESFISRQFESSRGILLLDLHHDKAGELMLLEPESRRVAIENVKKAAQAIGLETQVLPESYDDVLKGTIDPDHIVLKAGLRASTWTGAIAVRKKATDPAEIEEVRVCVVGNVDAGKSTTLGVLTKGVRDDGRGLVRVNLFRHQHEVDTGRTSSIGSALLGFDETGRPIYPPRTTISENAVPTTVARDQAHKALAAKASKIVSFSDLAGHAKYLRTTVYGLTSSKPDYCLLMVGSNQGLIGTAREHLGLALTLGLRVITVVTKIDMCPPSKLRETRSQILGVYKAVKKSAVPTTEITNVEECVDAAVKFGDNSIRPIFYISNVTGENVGLLKLFLSLLKPSPLGAVDAHAQMSISDTFSVSFVGTVVSGVVRSGRFAVDDPVAIGPSDNGDFITTKIRSIQILRKNVPAAVAGQSAAIALRNVPATDVRRGMVLQAVVAPPPGPHGKKSTLGEKDKTKGKQQDDETTATTAAMAHWEFIVDMHVLSNTTSMSSNYQAMTHIGAIEQTCSLSFQPVAPVTPTTATPDGGESKAEPEVQRRIVRGGESAIALCRFLVRPECVRVGDQVLFREGRTKAHGTVLHVGDDRAGLVFEKVPRKKGHRGWIPSHRK